MSRTILGQDIFVVSLGETIHDLRLERALSQQELAELAGVHRTYVSDIERGARNLTLTTVCRVASALGITASRLFKLVDDRMDRLNKAISER